MRSLVFWSVAIVFSGLAIAQNPSYQQDAKWHPPGEAMSRRNPLADKPEAAAGGKKLFLRNCAECHGTNGMGMEKKHSADLQLPVVQDQSDGTLFWKITNGNAGKGMPAFSKLPELQRWQVVLFIRGLKNDGPAVADPQIKKYR